MVRWWLRALSVAVLLVLVGMVPLGAAQEPLVIEISDAPRVDRAVHFSHNGAGNTLWDFGDGSTSNQPSAVHYYKQPGTYTVGLTADGEQASRQVTVQTHDCSGAHQCHDRNQEVSNAVLPYGGDLVVRDGARVVLTGSTMEFRSNSPAHVIVEAKSTLRLVDTALLSTGADVTLVIRGTLELVASDLEDIHLLLASGKVHQEAGSIAGTTVHVAGDGSWSGTEFDIDRLEVSGAARLTGAEGSIGQGRVEGVAAQLTTAGGALSMAALECLSGRVVLRNTVLEMTTGVSSACEGQVDGLQIVATGPAWTQTAAQLSAKQVSLTGGSGLRLTGEAAATVVGGVITATGTGIHLEGAGIVGLDKIDINAGTAVRCLDTLRLDAHGGAWSGTDAGAVGDKCRALLEHISIEAADVAVDWRGTQAAPFVMRHVNATAQETAFALRGHGVLGPANATAERGVMWTGADGAITDLTVMNAGHCAVCLTDGTFQVLSPQLAGSGTGLRVAEADVTVREGVLDGVGITIESGTMKVVDTDLNPLHNKVLGDAVIEATRNFQPVVVYKNKAPVVGASVSISSGGQNLASGSTDGQGHGPSVEVPVFWQDSQGIASGEALAVQATRNDLQATKQFAAGATLLDIVLIDDSVPTAVSALKQTVTSGEVVVRWDSATDDHLPPSYRVELALAGPGYLGPDGMESWARSTVATVTSSPATFSLPGQGAFDVFVTAIDASGNEGPETSIRTVWDEIPPVLNLTFQGDESRGWYRSPVTVELTGQDILSSIAQNRLRINGATVPGPHQITLEGTHQIDALIQDEAGNEVREQRIVRLDLGMPKTPVLSASATVFTAPVRASMDVVGDPTDAGSGVHQMRLERRAGDGWEILDRYVAPYPLAVAVDLEDGRSEFVLAVEDKAGNVARSAPVAMLVDGSPPELASTTLHEGMVQLRFTDNSSVVSIHAYDGDLLLASTTSDMIELDGKFVTGKSVRLVATDVAGNVGEFILDGNALMGVATQESPVPIAVVLVALLLAGGRKAHRLRDNKSFSECNCECFDGGFGG